MVVWNFLFMINLNGILNRIAVGLGRERASVASGLRLRNGESRAMVLGEQTHV